jgi:hypothetical protein
MLDQGCSAKDGDYDDDDGDKSKWQSNVVGIYGPKTSSKILQFRKAINQKTERKMHRTSDILQVECSVTGI